MRKSRRVLLTGVVAVGLSLLPAGAAFGSITLTCTNGGGNTPQGNCNGNGLTQQYENPAGHAPGGWNK